MGEDKNKASINWFPGHMAKAEREISEKIKLVDVIYELLDARIPLSSANPDIVRLTKGKPRIILLNKASLADPNQTKLWISHFASQGIKAIAIDALSGNNVNLIIKETKEVLAKKLEDDKKKGFRISTIRAMILGIPNVGKSTLINKIVKRNIAKTGDKPGVTKAQQWIKVNESLDLLDTPGILWPKFDNQDIAFRLAVSGAIKDDIIPMDEAAVYLMRFLDKYYPDALKNRYGLIEYDIDDIEGLYRLIGTKRGCIIGNEVCYDKVSKLLINEFRSLKLGRVTLDYYE